MSLYSRIIDLQKINQAWERVKKNKPAAGVDKITYEEFEQQKTVELKQLQIELQNHTYKALPVRRTILYKGEKKREIALYSMRDKVVQQSVAVELNKMYDAQISPQVYAYRNNKSALNAVNEIDEQLRTGKYAFMLKIDIEKFFDTILWENLVNVLRKQIKEDDVLHLIEENVKGDMLEDTGELTSKRLGIYQGSGISPVLSNIYMLEFDYWMAGQDCFYIRYSDDMLILGKEKDGLLQLFNNVKVMLEKLGLSVNEGKSNCVSIEQGVDFLGYHFSKEGKAVPAKAEQNLQERLEMMWLTSADLTIEEKVKKALEIIGGWEQYFRNHKTNTSVFEYVTLVYAAQGNETYFNELINMRQDVENVYWDIMQYLSGLWKEREQPELELLEYEQFYQIWDETLAAKKYSGDMLEELLQFYRKEVIEESKENATEIMQIYTDFGEYKKAEFWSEKIVKSDKVLEGGGHFLLQQEKNELVMDKNTCGKFMKRFVGREDLYSRETIGYGRKRTMEPQTIPLSEKSVMEHLCGKETIGTYVQRPNGTVRFMVLDIDISKKIMLQYDRDTPEYQAYLEKAFHLALHVQKIYKTLGLKGYVEYSGCRGYHVWLLFSEWIPVRYVNMLEDVILEKMGKIDENLTVECFPNKTRIKAGKFGQNIKLPYGVHIRTGEQSYFLDESGRKVVVLNSFLDSLAVFSIGAVKKILASNTGIKETRDNKLVEMNLEELGEWSKNITEVLKKCNLMRYLCQKAQTTGYLTHFERLSILYVFGHLGDEGKQFVHQIMSYTLNYQYNVTEKFIGRVPAKPVSCIKLREQYKMITAEYGCNCEFKRSKNCYPSPVLHAISLSTDLQEGITLPTSRTLSKEKEKKVMDEMNIHTKAQELATKILTLKKQKRSIDQSIRKIERELEQIYDNAGIDCLEVEMGLLVRRKTETGYEWFIEI